MTFTEKRRYERIPFSAGMTVTDVATGRRCEANSVNISAASIAFYAETLFPLDSRIRIQIRLRDAGREETVELGATVRRARPEQDGAVMGAEFDTILGPSHLPNLYDRVCVG